MVTPRGQRVPIDQELRFAVEASGASLNTLELRRQVKASTGREYSIAWAWKVVRGEITASDAATVSAVHAWLRYHREEALAFRVGAAYIALKRLESAHQDAIHEHGIHSPEYAATDERLGAAQKTWLDAARLIEEVLT